MRKRYIVLIVVAAAVLLLGLASALSPRQQGGQAPVLVEEERDLPTEGWLGQPLTYDGVQILAGPLFEGDSILKDPRVCATVEYQNTGSEVTRLTPFDWKLRTPQGLEIDPTFGGSDNDLPYGDIVAGGRASGDICFAAEFTETGSTLSYKPSIWSNDRLVWTQP